MNPASKADETVVANCIHMNYEEIEYHVAANMVVNSKRGVHTAVDISRNFSSGFSIMRHWSSG
jgi:hypothetical protein